MQQLAPEEIELKKKRAVLERLKDRLADREEDMTDLRTELEKFEANYSMQVGRLYADLDDIEAKIAEEEYKLVPDDEEIKKRAEELRRRAEESAARALQAAEAADQAFTPTLAAKKAYHAIARTIHPDLALDAAEKEKRHGLMAQLNNAYSSGDQDKLNKLVAEFRNSPDLVKGDSIGDELVRAIRQIFQVKMRLRELAEEKLTAEASELFSLRKKMEEEMGEGRDMVAQMAARTVVQIRKSTRRLENLKNVNLAQEEYVKEKYGMEISDFRQG